MIALNTKIRLGRRISALSAAEPHYNPRTTRQDHEPSIVTFERFDERLRIPFDSGERTGFELQAQCRDHGFSYSNNAGHGLYGPPRDRFEGPPG